MPIGLTWARLRPVPLGPLLEESKLSLTDAPRPVFHPRR